jgi:hypothetical protein
MQKELVPVSPVEPSVFPAVVMSLAGAVVLASGLVAPARRVAGLHPALGGVGAALSRPGLNAAMKVAGAAGFAVLVVAELARRERKKRDGGHTERPLGLPPHALTLPPTQTADVLH